MTTDIVVSAPGKVILHGEHSVVYGKVAVASSLNLRCFVRAAISKDADVTLDLPDVNICRKWSVASLENNLLQRLELCHDSHGHPSPPTEKSLHRLKQFAEIDTEESESRHLAIISFLYLYCYIGQRSKEQSGLPPIHVRMISQLPVGAGLGSSAAFSVCLAAVLLQLTGQATPSIHPEEQGDSNPAKGAVRKWSLDDLLLINKWAFLGEKIIHGHPSGIDNSVSTLGGAIRFQNKQITTVEKMPSIKILLTNTNVPRSTKTLVANVKNKHDKFPEVMGPVLQAMEGLAERSIKVYGHMFDRPDKWQGYSQLEELIDINQQLLNTIGVGHSSLDRVVKLTARQALHSKLTGAGGGGCAYTLLRPDTPDEKIQAACKDLEEAGFDCWVTNVGAVGVYYHSNPDSDASLPERLLERI